MTRDNPDGGALRVFLAIAPPGAAFSLNQAGDVMDFHERPGRSAPGINEAPGRVPGVAVRVRCAMWVEAAG